jgi:hypothetical protein
MDSFWIIVAFVLGAVITRWASTPKSTETPVQTLKRAYTAITEPKPETVEEDVPNELEKALHEMKPPNVFERRNEIEREELRLAQLRASAVAELR